MSETPGQPDRASISKANRLLKGGSTSEKGTNEREVKDEPIDDYEKSPEKEVICSVDSCKKSTPSSKVEFLPHDNVLEAVNMIMLCKASIYEQNFLIQRYLEAHHLAHRPEAIPSVVPWTYLFPFHACERHFNRSKKLAFYLPLQIGQSWRNYEDLIHREGLFHMYRVPLRVDYFFDTKEAAKQFQIGCVISRCTSNPLKMNHLNGRPFVKLIPLPVDLHLHSEWHKSIKDGHNKLCTFTPRLPIGSVICEKHFVNGGQIVNGKMELPTLFHDLRARVLPPPQSAKRPIDPSQQTVYRIGDKRSKNSPIDYCLVRCCPINSNSMKSGRRGKYVLYEVPGGQQGRKWLAALKEADPGWRVKGISRFYVCERHFAPIMDVKTVAIPSLFLTPPEASMSRAETAKESSSKDGPCPCCSDVELCQSILRRFNSKMNTLMQHVNMLCVLEGVKEVLPRPFNDRNDDLDLYGDPEKVNHLDEIRAASMFVREAKGELSAVRGALDNMSSRGPRRACALLSCCYSRNPRRSYRLVDADQFEDDLLSGELLVTQERDCASVRRVLAKDGQVAMCERHWKSHISNISVEFDEDTEDVKKLKEALALPVDFQPKFKKRRTEELEDPAPGTSAVVKVEVQDDEEEDERILSNNELLQRLLGGAIAGQVTGEIGDDGEVYEGDERGEEEEMNELDNQDPHEEGEGVEEEEEGPPELD